MPVTLDEVKELFARLTDCGPRTPGSQGEQACLEVVADSFRQAGLAVEVQQFSFSRLPLLLASKGVPVAACACYLAAGLLLPKLPLAAGLVLTGLLGLFAALALFHRLGNTLFDAGRQERSCNVIARTAPPGPGALTVVLSAHYDSKAQHLSPLARKILLFIKNRIETGIDLMFYRIITQIGLACLKDCG